MFFNTSDMSVRWVVWGAMVSVPVMGRLVVRTKEELMIIDEEGRKTLDLMRIVEEGDKVNSTLVESDCPGVMEETAGYEFVTTEDEVEHYHTVEITRVIDTVTEGTVTNVDEPWIIGTYKIR